MSSPSPDTDNPSAKLLEVALEIKDPAEREKYLEQSCGSDHALLNEVRSLLGFAQMWEDFSEDTPTLVGKHVGKYMIKEEIGRGGMGTVYLGVRNESYKDLAAIKIIKRDMLSQDSIRRFGKEMKIMARLKHQYLARLLDGGLTEDGLPFVVMDYIEGHRIDEYCDANKLTIKERLALFREVCSVVSYVHKHGVIHRDIKPSNILVTYDGHPKLIDFGIAKILNPTFTTATFNPTNLLQRAFSPDYASPEQVRGDLSIGETADVYSLGAVLYELLTGHSPHKFRDKSFEEIRRVVCENQIIKPSQVVLTTENGSDGDGKGSTPESISAARDTQPTQLRRQLAGNLDAILIKAMCKEPRKRYQSVVELAADIDNYLQGRPVNARRGSRRAYLERLAGKVSDNLPPIGFRWRTKLALYLAVFLLLAGFSQFNNIKRWYYMSYYLVDPFNPKGTPLSDRQRKDLTQAIDRLSSHLNMELEKNQQNHNTWETAQMATSLNGKTEINLRRLNEYWSNNIDASCNCWNFINQYGHLGASSWLLLSASRLKLPLPSEQVNFILKNQKSDGWWSIYSKCSNDSPCSDDQINASTYATVMSVLALNEYVESGMASSGMAERIKQAIANGQRWLLKNHVKDKASWFDHPINPKPQESVGLSGLVLHALHRTNADRGSLDELDRSWLNNLPNLKIDAKDGVTSQAVMEGGLYEETNNYAMPWAIIATVDTYQNATRIQRAKVLAWVDVIIKNLDSITTGVIGNTDWIAAELLISLRYLSGEIKI